MSMTRTVNGVVETKTAKEVVVAYANAEVQALKLFEKKAWSMLFPRVNKDLDPQFVEAEVVEASEVEEAVELISIEVMP